VVRTDGDYLYEERKGSSDAFYAFEMHCETKRDNSSWSGKCRYSFSWLTAGLTSVTCSVDTKEVITSVTATRIEGKSQPLDFSPFSETPHRCPVPGMGWREFAMIPIE
jgi:hypothetical protein